MEVATKIASLSISVRPRPYRCNTLRRSSTATLLSVTDLTQQLKWCGGAIVASARQQRRRNRTAVQENAGEEIGGVGQAVLSALKPEVPQPSNSRVSSESGRTNERRSAGGDGEGGRAETALSGSDVLLALQKTAAAGRGKGSRKRRRNGRGGVAEEDAMDYSSVRPLSINRDWGVRLDDVEKRLQDLLQL
ncbi:uncharacterized protein LOC122672646 [Telopea speciosissima]|uniref:uncharacterized protein LOC122672646 n=1 Tax=Telopea speciosissima TaxID=54955 RepID=UPI001CC46739|nr:uncharacterized protein LOC122672646 [Telopea speciosissima]